MFSLVDSDFSILRGCFHVAGVILHTSGNVGNAVLRRLCACAATFSRVGESRPC